ncbi:hypothetical protein M3936_12715 [Sutcliffiella horikoshii]|uniref:hypothetical protein n=1 Tax=Sutcliffiella horikoshii TaxID=79883 RepID=UPI002041F72F|nr:hypothetical protein [Sutcliffiella horikoshii]MCM3618444.1 hypothetical protein [Sutcliffiella horikoshii]
MKLELVNEYCNATGRIFKVVKVTLSNSYSKDRDFIKLLKIKSQQLATSVNKQAANNSTKTRSKERLHINCAAGILAEVCWKICINMYYKQHFVKVTNFDKSSNQIDLLVIHSGKSIEVRSSFPRNGINFALCDPTYQFDVIGPYTNSVKVNEPSKDFYVRTLYPINVIDFMDFLNNDSVEFFLTGGANWGMMTDSTLSKDKNFVPDDAIVEEKSTYRVVPFEKALDTIGILESLKD